MSQRWTKPGGGVEVFSKSGYLPLPFLHLSGSPSEVTASQVKVSFIAPKTPAVKQIVLCVTESSFSKQHCLFYLALQFSHLLDMPICKEYFAEMLSFSLTVVSVDDQIDVALNNWVLPTFKFEAGARLYRLWCIVGIYGQVRPAEDAQVFH